ncbi:MAG TPA: hypothetical protein VFW87_19275 [Pirellulales bacterium]|nr:hypothetical protein [Pirellulales bacterium]
MRPNCTALFVLACGGWFGGATCEAREPFDLNDQALATFDFEGMALPTSTAQLTREFPAARRDAERIDEEIGLECYEVDNLANADRARFYFCDGKLYQFEVEYSLPRVEKLGGMAIVLQKLVDRWGPVDHAGESRWTWQRPTYKRRADFYAWPDKAQLTMTDMTWMPIVERRIKRQDAKERLNLGI